MKVSIITPTYNSAQTVRDTIESVLSQDYDNIEYIIIDGYSKDNTLDIIKEYSDQIAVVVSEPDKGIYDAMNKGIRLATGDVVGILNSDDFFTSNDVISIVVKEFMHNQTDAIYGDIHFVRPENLNKCVRYYSSAIFSPFLFRFGFMPAHPSFYVKKSCYEQLGTYDLNYRIAADYDLMIRFLYKEKIRYKYLKKDFVTMRIGGISTEGVNSRILLNKEIVRACKKYGIYTNLFFLSLKYIYKVFELRR